MIILQNISYIHPNKDVQFNNINLTVNKFDKVALMGNNGSGKSTLMKIISGSLQHADGQLAVTAAPYVIPQIFGQYNHLTVAQALGIDQKLTALESILNGEASEDSYDALADDWTIEDRCAEALHSWGLASTALHQKMGSLSGGQKTKVFLAGIQLHEPELILMDEPSNHLDTSARTMLYDFVRSTRSTLMVVSHDRQLLNLLPRVCELTATEIKVYGGNYEYYIEQKQVENKTLTQNIVNKEKALRKAREKERETLERQQKLDAQGKGKHEKAGVARIMMNTLRNNAENSTAKLKNVHAGKIADIRKDLHDLRGTLPAIDKMKVAFEQAELHHGKVLFKATAINFAYGTDPIWKDTLSLQVNSGERIAVKGDNGSGKTTLIQMILGNLEPHTGTVYRAPYKSVYIDQEYSLIDDRLTVYDQANGFNTSTLQEHEIKIRLNRFLFTQDDWDKPCGVLSGGEKLRLMLCCLAISNQSPDMIILDEPTNNLDIQNVAILTAAINQYQGTLVVVSHDVAFLSDVNTERIIQL